MSLGRETRRCVLFSTRFANDHVGNTDRTQIRGTQKAIKEALTERCYAWEDAYSMAQEDPKINLHVDSGTPAYTGRLS